ncbi:MAG TPA: orotidine-5'-phosphate decarboxylase [Tepidisphaeraceae bacterium]|jgi:orotidine-5'-phosphate decarboxylase|nr:orotidine-5'-phosphate decarboxylase [Tepidisphaeraceae bacterium]
MDEIFPDRLLAAIEAKGSPICVGIDPIFEMLPDAIAGDPKERDANDAEGAIDAIFTFTTTLLRLIAPHVPIVKFQSAYFEKYLWEGVEAYYSLIQEAAELGLLVIGDVKRGDIGTTASAYAAAHLADPVFNEHEDVVVPDAITVNPMLGLDTLEPFITTAKTFGKGLFVLVRTSNPGSADFQDAKLADGRTWSEMLADRLAPIAAQAGLVGNRGFSAIGAVVGATQEHTISSLRKRLPQSIFLLPGYGTQGATAQMTQAAFKDGKGAIISASRSILYAHREPKYAGMEWQAAVERAMLDMKRDIASIL